MARATRSPASRKRKKKILKLAKGYWGDRSKRYKQAKITVERGLVFSYRDRRQRKRDFRALWIIRINAACRLNNISYSVFLHGLLKAKIALDRKMLAEVAANDPKTFKKLVEMSQMRPKLTERKHS